MLSLNTEVLCLLDEQNMKRRKMAVISPLPSGTLATFFLTAVGLIQHTNEDDIGREKTILMT